mmetsp:Transcript_48612/g.152754  ORF Transcript_48612/g.152754 Transcript_48612/m.152754 type:complete len:232 (-) Transcript_48612:567-1262(-)
MLATVHRHSFLTSNSSRPIRPITSGNRGVAISWSICAAVPAAMLESAQQASLRVRDRSELRNLPTTRRKPASSTAPVAPSEPVRRFASARRAGTCTDGDAWSRWWTRRGRQPAETTPSAASPPASATCERAHMVSIMSSESSSESSFARVGSARSTCSRAGAGLLRTKLERHQVALRSGPICEVAAISSIMLSTLGNAPQPRSMSRSEAQSPATLERAHTACSRVSTEGEV